MNLGASFLLAPTSFLPCRQAMAAIFFEPEQLAHEQLLLGTRAGRSAASGVAAGGGDAGGGDAGGGDAGGGDAGGGFAGGGEAGAGAAVLVVPEFYRAKGLFEVAGSGRMYALQAVQSTYELVEGPPWSDAQPHCQHGLARRRPCGQPPLQTSRGPPAGAGRPSGPERSARAAWGPEREGLRRRTLEL